MTSARLAREHNDANVVALGARLIGLEVAVAAAPMLVGDVLDWFADPASWEGPNGIVNRLVEHVLLTLSAVFVTYFVAGFLARPDWGAAAEGMVVPAIPLTRDALRPWLPIRSKLIHCKWSGESTWVPFGPEMTRLRPKLGLVQSQL